MPYQVFLDSNDNFVKSESADWHYQKGSFGSFATNWTTVHEYTVITSGYYEVKTGITVKAAGTDFSKWCYNKIAIDSYVGQKSNSLASVYNTNTGNDYGNAFNHWCGYVNAGEKILLIVRNDAAIVSLWEWSMMVRPWGVSGQRISGLDKENNFVQSTGSDHHYINDIGNAAVALSLATWKNLNNITFTTSGTYRICSSVTSYSANPAALFVYNRICKNSPYGVGSIVAASLACSKDNGSGANWYQSSFATAVAYFSAGETANLWTYITAVSGTTSPTIWEYQFSATPYEKTL